MGYDSNRVIEHTTYDKNGILSHEGTARQTDRARAIAYGRVEGRFFRKSHCPRQGFVAEALRDIVVNYVCRDRAERLWQFGVRTKPACRPGRAAVRGCMLIDTRKPGRPTCGLRKTCRSVG